jgi:hypothetical protein
MSFVSSNRTTFLFMIVAVALIFLLPLLVKLPDETSPAKKDRPAEKSEQTSADSLKSDPNHLPSDSVSN